MRVLFLWPIGGRKGGVRKAQDAATAIITQALIVTVDLAAECARIALVANHQLVL